MALFDNLFINDLKEKNVIEKGKQRDAHDERKNREKYAYDGKRNKERYI